MMIKSLNAVIIDPLTKCFENDWEYMKAFSHWVKVPMNVNNSAN